MIILKVFFKILFLKCKLKNRTCRNVFIVFIKTLHSLVLYIITLVISIFFWKIMYLLLFPWLRIPGMWSQYRRRQMREVCCWLLWRRHQRNVLRLSTVSLSSDDPIRSVSTSEIPLIPTHPWEAPGSFSFLDVYVELQFYLCNRFQYGNLRKWV